MRPPAPSRDPRAALAAELFSRLCRDVLTEAQDGLAAERRLWRLPEVATSYAFDDAPTPAPEVLDEVVVRLRLEAGEIINRLIDRRAMKHELARRLDEAAHAFMLRPWRGDDQAPLAALLDDRALWAYMPEGFPGRVTEELAGALIAVSNEFPGRHRVFAVEWRGKPVGQVRLQFDSSSYAHSAEISYWLGQSHWGRGLATGFVSLFTSRCFTDHQGLERVFAKVLEGNEASMRVLEKCGYRYESFRHRDVAKEGRTYGAHVFSVCRADYTLNAADMPASAPAVRQADPPRNASWVLLCSLAELGEALVAFA